MLIFSGKSRQKFFFFQKRSQAVTSVFFSNCDLFLSSGETGTATTKEEPNKPCFFLSVIRYIPLKLILFFFSSLLSSKQKGIPSSHLDFFFFSRNKNKLKANLLFPPLFFNLLFNTLSCNTHSLLFFFLPNDVPPLFFLSLLRVFSLNRTNRINSAAFSAKLEGVRDIFNC